MTIWAQARDSLTTAERALKADGGPTPDQLLQIALVEALLSIGQELSLIQDQGVNPEFSQRHD